MDANLLSKFVAAVQIGEPDLELRHINNVYQFVFRKLPEVCQLRLAALSEKRFIKFVYDWQADLPTPGLDDIGEQICYLVQEYDDLVMPVAETLAENSDRNLDAPHIWTWMLARLPLTKPLADAILAMSDDEKFAFSCGQDPEDLDPNTMKNLDAKFPGAGILAAVDRLNDLYSEGESCHFGLER